MNAKTEQPHEIVDRDMPEGWRPEPGDELTGKIIDVDSATSTQRDRDGNYPVYPLLRIQKDDGEEVFVHCFHQTLQKGILTQRPEIGHRIRVKFHGKQTLKSDPTRSVAVYSLELPDTPKSAASIYDRIEKGPRRTAPITPDPGPPVDHDDFLDDIGS